MSRLRRGGISDTASVRQWQRIKPVVDLREKQKSGCPRPTPQIQPVAMARYVAKRQGVVFFAGRAAAVRTGFGASQLCEAAVGPLDIGGRLCAAHTVQMGGR